jgi:large subunit ribosomal protein L23
MEELYSIIKRPLITEKSNRQKEAQNQYLFEVDRRANKIDIKKAVERLFRVKVDRVNVSMVHGKVKRLGKNMGKRPDWKKAVVLLKEGDRIDFFEGA